jgi:hypothetical protein
MAEQSVMCFRAERGAKYEDTGQCIGSFNGSIVFLPRSVRPDEVVRVRLIPIEGKVDRNNRVMYRAEFAPLDLSVECRHAIATEAQELRGGQAFARDQGEALLGVIGVANIPGRRWYYVCGERIYGSDFPPAALGALQLLPQASEGGLMELVAWVTESAYYSATQERGEKRTPEYRESAITSLQERTSRGERVLSVLVALPPHAVIRGGFDAVRATISAWVPWLR